MQTEKRWYGATFPLPNTQPGCKNLVELLNAVNANTAAFSYLYVYLSYVSRTKSLTRYVVYRFCPSGCSCKQNMLRAWKCHSHKEYAMAFLLYACKTGVNPNRFSPVVLTVAEQDIRGGKCLKRPNNEW